MGTWTSFEPEDRAHRARWFARTEAKAPSADQEAEVRERLYARPDPNERNVHLVGPARRMADRHRPAA